ncbi:MAG: pyruvate kinase [Candidatus Paceibacterota bacterium]
MKKLSKEEIISKRVDCRANIIATMGPACMQKEQIAKIVESGAFIFRLNFSHGDYLEKQQMIDNVRAIEKSAGTILTIFQDLQGPKIRLGKIKDGYAKLKMGQNFILTTEKIEGDENIASISHAQILKDIEAGKEIYINDGLVKLIATKIEGDKIHCKVVDDGEISTGRGVNFPGTSVRIPAITEKDKKDLAFALGAGIDMVALSFVRSAKDIEDLRGLMKKNGRIVPIIAKIEKWEAVEGIDEIIDASDVIMVARGDLGVELPVEQVPVIQKRIIAACRKKGKPVITATQMLISMVENPTPTRAEVSDIANAVFDGTDTVMLSNETAVGKYGPRAVETMIKVIKNTEQNERFMDLIEKYAVTPGSSSTESIADAACKIAQNLNAKVIVCATESGSSARLISKHRPEAYVIAMTSQEDTLRKLSFSWGVMPVKVKPFTSSQQTINKAVEVVKAMGVAKAGDTIVVTCGTITQQAGTTNLIKVEKI